jgi:hypothetical protein
VTDKQLPVNMKELRERWGLSANALKARAKALGVEILRPNGNSSYWPGDKIELGEQLHQWLQDGHPMNMFPAVLETQGNVSSLTRQSPATDGKVTALVPIRQRMQELRQEDPLALARRLVEAADLGVPLTNQEMAEVLGLTSMSKDKDGSSPRPGFVIQRIEHNGTPFWSVLRSIGSSAPVTSASVPGSGADRKVGFSTAASLSVIDVRATDCTGSDLFSRMTLAK